MHFLPQSLGFKLGVFHVECKYTSRGARLIEVNCRMGGGPVRDTNLLVWGVDLVEEHLMACAGGLGARVLAGVCVSVRVRHQPAGVGRGPGGGAPHGVRRWVGGTCISRGVC